ncbi:CoA-binding protein [Robiginitalea sp. IMCC44478]|uniref:CoA-binding protein n=1 Tax=Robiginitalea sp. IMCC44478 TaxID=3459122 RepID=UPI0040423C7F
MVKTLVFGASLNPGRYSNIAIKRLVQHGYEVVAFGLRSGTAHGIPVRTSLENIGDIDTITLYMNPRRQEAFYQKILEIRPRRVIFNPGTENPELYALLKREGISLEIGCTLVMLSMGQY